MLLANPFNIKAVGDGCPVCQTFFTNLSAAEIKLTEMQKEQALKDFSQCHSRIDF